MTKRRLLNISLLVLALIVFLLLKKWAQPLVIGTALRLEDCESKTDLRRDECISKLANELQNHTLCDRIYNPLVKDICHRDAVLRENSKFHCNMLFTFIPVFEYFEEVSCLPIDDPWIQYVCVRLHKMRPHMGKFMSKRPVRIEALPPDLPEECDQYDGYHRLFCTYSLVADLSKSDMNAALGICNRISDEKLRGECKFFIAIPIAIGIEEETEKKIATLMDFCQEVSNPSWKSECYYLLADELTWKMSIEDIEEIARACEASVEARDYVCPDHVVQMMPRESGILFCEAIDEQNKPSCWYGWGYERERDRFRSNDAFTDPCEDVPTEWRKDCWDGFGLSAAEQFSDDTPGGIERCQALPEGRREACLYTLAWAIGERHIGDNFSELERCDELSGEMQLQCMIALEITRRSELVKDVPSGTKKCGKLTGKASEDCLYAIADAIVEFYLPEPQCGMNACNELPDKVRWKCLTTP